MYNRTIIACAFCLFLLPEAGPLAAGEFSPSASYLRMQSMAIVPNSIDAAYYNPAGLAGLDNGLYFDLGYQVMAKTVKHEMARMGGEDTEPSLFIPQFAAAFKKGSGAFFLSLCMPEGVERAYYNRPKGGMPLVSYFSLDLDPVQMATLRGAGLTVPLGSMELPMITWVKANRYWLQGRIGGSFSLHELFAVTGGVSCSYFEGDHSAGVLNWGSVDKIEKVAVGWSGFFGIMLGKPEGAMLAVLYSTQVIARGTEKNVKYNYTRVMEERLPDYLLIGLNWPTSDKTAVRLSYRVDFSGERNFGTRNLLTRSHELGYLDWLMVARSAAAWSAFPLIATGNAQNYKHRVRHSFGAGIEFPIKGIIASAGLSYSSQEKYPRAQNPLDPDLQRVGIGAGVRINASKSIVVDTGTAYYFYITDRMLYNSIRMERGAWMMGLSVTVKAM